MAEQLTKIAVRFNDRVNDAQTHIAGITAFQALNSDIEAKLLAVHNAEENATGSNKLKIDTINDLTSTVNNFNPASYTGVEQAAMDACLADTNEGISELQATLDVEG